MTTKHDQPLDTHHWIATEALNMENTSAQYNGSSQFLDGNSTDTCESNTPVGELLAFQASLQPLQTGILVSYLVTMTVGLLGNSLVIYVIAKNSQIRNKSVANYYIWNLAFADLFFVLTMPLFCYATYSNGWSFGDPMCKLSKVFFETNRYASMFTLVALSFDRYLASFYNMGHLRTVKAGIITCCVIWTLCATISIPYWMYSNVKDGQCKTGFPSWFMTFWTFFQLSLALLIPFILICVSYILLAVRLQMILNTSSAKSASVHKPSRKMLRTVLVVVIIFLVCQVPWHVNELISLHKHVKYNQNNCLPTISEMKLSTYLNMISTILGFISSCCNPIVYGILNDNYRKQYSTVLCCCCYKRVMLTNGSSITGQRTSMATETHTPRVYRFQISFHPPCFKQKRATNSTSAKHHKLSIVSQDCTIYKAAETEHIEMDEQSGED